MSVKPPLSSRVEAMLRSGDEYLATVARMEPDITSVDLPAAAASISISLKRLADAFGEGQMKEIEHLQAVRLAAFELATNFGAVTPGCHCPRCVTLSALRKVLGVPEPEQRLDPLNPSLH